MVWEVKMTMYVHQPKKKRMIRRVRPAKVFEIGDRYKVIGIKCPQAHPPAVGRIIRITGANTGRVESAGYFITPEYYELELITTIKEPVGNEAAVTGEEEMDKTIMKMFPKTADAVLVNKFFSNRFENPILNIVIADKADEILAAANKLQEEQDKEDNS